MLTLAPDYYPHFACIAGRCRHTCCKGWEIAVDEASQQRYAAVKGPLGQRLRDAMEGEGEDVHFALQGPEERCPFLNSNSLCDLITELGADSLCQICDDHPRFFHEWSTFTEAGLGLCCEEAARLILTWPDAVGLMMADEDDADGGDLTDEEQDLLSFRSALIGIAQDRTQPMEARMRALCEYAGCGWPGADPEALAAMLMQLERLDPAWTSLLERLKTEPVPDLALAPWAAPLEQLMVYLLYRHLPDVLHTASADADGYGAMVRVCCLMWRTAVMMFAQSDRTMASLIEICRMMSAEIEYSDENLDLLLDLA